MKINIKWLEKNKACEKGKIWFKNQKHNDVLLVLESLVAEQRFEWANWLITKVFEHKQKIEYAVFAAKQVIDIYTRKNIRKTAVLAIQS